MIGDGYSGMTMLIVIRTVFEGQIGALAQRQCISMLKGWGIGNDLYDYTALNEKILDLMMAALQGNLEGHRVLFLVLSFQTSPFQCF